MSEEKKLENTQQDSTDTENEEVEEESTAKTKAGKVIEKHKRKVKRKANNAKAKLIQQLQLVLFVGLVLVVLMWGGINSVLNFFSGFSEIEVWNKTIDNGCYEIIIPTGESYCLDEKSYNIAEVGRKYKLEKMQYHHSLRVVK